MQNILEIRGMCKNMRISAWKIFPLPFQRERSSEWQVKTVRVKVLSLSAL